MSSQPTLIVDVDVDWLYKGKKLKKKHTVTPSGTSAETSQQVSKTGSAQPMQPAQSLPQEPAPSSGSHISNITPQLSPKASVPLKSLTPQRTLSLSTPNTQSSSAVLNRARASSVASKQVPTPTMTGVPSEKSSGLSRSASLGEKPKKGFLSGLFKKATPAAKVPTPASTSSTPPSLPPIDTVTRRRSSSSSSSGLGFLASRTNTASTHSHPPTITERVVLNKNPNKSIDAMLSEVPLKRVTFAVDKLPTDPPQQIPSRKPKRGNVIIPEDLMGTVPRLNVGITNDATTPLESVNKAQLQKAMDAYNKALAENEKHAMDAHRAAMRMAQEVAQFKTQKGSAVVITEDINVEGHMDVANLGIDGPIHHHSSFPVGDEESEDSEGPISLETIYTRCCHLREILPIPATLKQLKDKTMPLNVLKFLNPRPTLIDIYSFSDFLRIVEISHVVFDNVALTTEMLKIILCSLSHSKFLVKLSLRNVVIDPEGWRLLSKFVLQCKSLSKLDISQQKVKADLDPRMLRYNQDWDLFLAVLVERGGIEELLCNGVKLPVSIMERLFAQVMRMGLSGIEMTLPQLECCFKWLHKGKLQGIDMGFNDLWSDSMVRCMIKGFDETLDNVQYVTLNSTGFRNAEDLAMVIRSLSKLPKLAFLDLSNLPDVFPDIFPYLNKYLPLFPELKRLHFDGNDFRSKDLSLLANIFPKCEKLLHVSIMNSPDTVWTPASGVALYDAAKNSGLTNLDVNYDLLDERISSRIALCLIRNTHRKIDSGFREDPETKQDELMFDGDLVTETAELILGKLNHDEDEVSRKYLMRKYQEKLTRIRGKINKTIADLFQQQSMGMLTLQQKENLVRFVLMEQTLDNILAILSDSPTAAPVSHAGDVVHNLVADLDSGKTIDHATGRPVLLRSESQTHLEGRRQEVEEGEFHKWGFFVQQQNSIYPAAPGEKPALNITKVPSGNELREALIHAKGIRSIDSLIDSVNDNSMELRHIYNGSHMSAPLSPSISSPTICGESVSESEADSGKDDEAADEAFDELLDKLSRVRSNK